MGRRERVETGQQLEAGPRPCPASSLRYAARRKQQGVWCAARPIGRRRSGGRVVSFECAEGDDRGLARSGGRAAGFDSFAADRALWLPRKRARRSSAHRRKTSQRVGLSRGSRSRAATNRMLLTNRFSARRELNCAVITGYHTLRALTNSSESFSTTDGRLNHATSPTAAARTVTAQLTVLVSSVRADCGGSTPASGAVTRVAYWRRLAEGASGYRTGCPDSVGRVCNLSSGLNDPDAGPAVGGGARLAWARPGPGVGPPPDGGVVRAGAGRPAAGTVPLVWAGPGSGVGPLSGGGGTLAVPVSAAQLPSSLPEQVEDWPRRTTMGVQGGQNG